MASASSPITLPQWYAAFTPDGGAVQAGLSTRDGAGLRLGAITLFRAGEGCTHATFGHPDNPGVVICDGYLYDRRRLKQELSLEPDAPDSAVVAASYQRWGTGVFDRLDGGYLIAIWDPREHRLLLGHDSLGHHPVYYADRPDTFWFTSNVMALPSSGAVARTPNRVSLAMTARMSWPAAGATFFEQVNRLRPGRYLTINSSRACTETAYWSPFLDDDDPGITEQQAWDGFEPTLLDAIGRCMEIEPDGIMLSGGLDSVTIAALAAEHANARKAPLVTAVSGRRDYPPADEEPMQTATAQALGMRHIVARESEWLMGRRSAELSLDVVHELPGPSRVYWVGGYIAFYRFMAERGVHVALTGSGGDNWASVGDAYAAHSMRHLRVGDLVQHMRSWMGTGGLSFKAAALHLLWSGGVRLLLDSYSARFLPGLKRAYHTRRALSAQPPWLCPDRSLKSALADTLYQQRPAALTSDGRVPPNFYRHSARSDRNPYYHYEYEVGFHIDSMCGLRLLSPYHDRQVVRFLNSIPPQVLMHGDSYKGMLRPLAEKRLPGLGLGKQRKVHGTGVRETELREFRAAVCAAWPKHNLKHLADLAVIDVVLAKQHLNPETTTTLSDLVTMQALMSADRWLGVHTRP